MKQFLILITFWIIAPFLLGGGGGGVASAQQLSLYSQYMLNDFVLNPAIAGSRDDYEFKSNIRYQWVGFANAPRTFTVSANIPFKPKKMGLGGYIINDVAGPIVRTGVNFAYAYHIQIREDMNLSMGLFAGLLQYKFNNSKIELADEEERYLFENNPSLILPDAAFGTYLYADNYFFGLSLNQLFHNRIKEKMFDKTSQSFGTLVRHLFITGGYKYQLNDDFGIEPSFLIKVLSPLPVQLDMSARVIYRDEIWLGVSFRTNDAFSVLLGYNYNEKLYFGYSYDFTTSDLRKYSSGTHEIMVGYHLEGSKKPQKRKKGKAKKSLI